MSQPSLFDSPKSKESSISSDSEPSYHYKPLPTSPPTIRLVKIQPPSSFSFDEAVFCEIHHVNLDLARAIGYHALSYVWGEPIFDQNLSLNGFPLRVTSHLYKALQSLRWHGVSWAWIDAVCIDQSNVTEKNTQVPLMGKIFGSARETVIYLGEADREESRAIALMKRLATLKALLPRFEGNDSPRPQRQLPEKDIDTLSDSPDADHPANEQSKREEDDQWQNDRDNVCNLAVGKGDINKYLHALKLPLKGDCLWATLASLYHRPWFSRGWVVQEAVLAQHILVILSHEAFDFMSLYDCRKFVLGTRLWLPGYVALDAGGDITSIIVSMRLQTVSRHLLNLLVLLEQCRTTDPRDKIYCLLGLTEDSDVLPKPDYSQSVGTVYRSYAIRLIQNSENLELLRAAGVAHGAIRADGTWVPQWDLRPPSRTRESGLFHASGAVHADFTLGEDPTLLSVRGLRLGSVNGFRSQRLLASHTDDVRAWESNVADVARRSPTYSTDRYSRALSADNIGNGPSCSTLTFADLYTRIFDGRNSTFTDSQDDPLEGTEFDDQGPGHLKEMDPNDTVYLFLISARARIDRFLLTRQGLMGWIPECSEEGDLICVIFGVSLPLVLREVEEGKHILIGTAYIDGFMYGEAIKDESLVAEEFFLA